MASTLGNTIPRNRVALALLGIFVCLYFVGTGLEWWPYEPDFWVLLSLDVIAFWAVPVRFLWLYLALNGCFLAGYAALLFSYPERPYFQTSFAIGLAVASLYFLSRQGLRGRVVRTFSPCMYALSSGLCPGGAR
jgi:hypothetical protein